MRLLEHFKVVIGLFSLHLLLIVDRRHTVSRYQFTATGRGAVLDCGLWLTPHHFVYNYTTVAHYASGAVSCVAASLSAIIMSSHNCQSAIVTCTYYADDDTRSKRESFHWMSLQCTSSFLILRLHHKWMNVADYVMTACTVSCNSVSTGNSSGILKGAVRLWNCCLL